MNLLILTQKVDKDDAVLGFFHSWILNLAKYYKQVTVICLKQGKYDLPANVKVLSLGKEKNNPHWLYGLKFYQYIWQERKNYNVVFVHMNVEYVILGAWLWKLLHKKLGLWYMHKNVSWRLRLAEKFSDIIFTGSAASFRLPSHKLKVLHHGIDSSVFSFKAKTEHEELRLLSVSRISATKQLDKMIDILPAIKNKINSRVILKIAGDTIVEKDEIFFQQLKDKISSLGLGETVEFVGPIPNKQMPPLYQWADVFLNFSLTGSVDKAVLEAMSCGTMVLVSNEAFREMLFSLDQNLYLDDYSQAVDRLTILVVSDKKSLALGLSEYVKNKHSLDNLIKEIVSLLK